MIYKTGEYMACGDCLQWLANADASGLDYHYNADEAAARLANMKAGERRLTDEAGALYVADDESRERDFSPLACDVCGDCDAGARYPVDGYTPAHGRELPGTAGRPTGICYVARPFIRAAWVSPPRHNGANADGYGRKIASQYVVFCADNRRRRVYVMQFSNAGTAYILVKGERLLIGAETETMLDNAGETL